MGFLSKNSKSEERVVMRKFLCSILRGVMLLSLVPTAFAAAGIGLSGFADSKEYSNGTFTDVPDAAQLYITTYDTEKTTLFHLLARRL